MKKWEINIVNLSFFLFRTPWFAIIYSHYDYDCGSARVWLGFEFWWKSTENIKEGDLYFQKYKRFEIDSLSMHEMQTRIFRNYEQSTSN